ncbi:hypothetical protein BLNAU_12152 [Blattamonas nauphoetae]|uniref:Uncharacterized protein n=1 Tax=Blattamonas nauphoetae TaxID=2049346 RepID=A0ABQ9XLC5_9EUKA|nr:hypothetical protein BLNAU_12152 [Blattamonas nauphoetae]
MIDGQQWYEWIARQTVELDHAEFKAADKTPPQDFEENEIDGDDTVADEERDLRSLSFSSSSVVLKAYDYSIKTCS